jgi:cell division protein FtsB
MNAKQIVCSIFLIIVLFYSVKYGNVFVEKHDQRQSDIYDRREEYADIDATYTSLCRNIERLEEDVNYSKVRIEHAKEKVQRAEARLSHEAYLTYNRNNISKMSYDDYLSLMGISLSLTRRGLENLETIGIQLENELAAAKKEKIEKTPILSRKKAEYILHVLV